MNFFEKQFTFDRVVRIVITIVIIAVAIFLLDFLSPVLIPFVIASIFAYLINPFVNLLQRLVKKRAIAVFLSLFIITVFLTGLGFIFVPIITKEFSQMSVLIQNLVQKSDLEKQIQTYLPEKIADDIEAIILSKDIQLLFDSENIGGLREFFKEKVMPQLGYIFSETMNIIVGLLSVFVIILYLVFMLLYYDKISSGWKTLIPPKFKNIVLEVVQDYENAMHRYFRAQTLLAAIVGTMFSIGFVIIDLPLGLLFGIFIGFLNLIPYLQNIAFVPAVLLALLKSLETGTNFWIVLAMVAAVFVIIFIIQDYFLVPKIMGKATGFNPVVIILSISVWGKLLGPLGLLIALPTTYLLLSYYKRFIHKPVKAMGPSRKPKMDFRQF